MSTDPACTGITATHCPVHGDCTCPRPSDTGYEPMEYLNAGGCPLHDPSSDHGEARDNVERLREVVAAAEHYTLRRGWAVLVGHPPRCHDCNASIDTDDHADGCDYDRLKSAVEALYA